MSDDPCICVSLRKAGRRLTAVYDDALAPSGVLLAQFSLLRNIRRHGPVSLTKLGNIVELDRSTLGRNVRVLERMGLVAPASGTDLREARIELTEKGHDTLAASEPLWNDAQKSIRTKLGAEGAAQLHALLSAL